MRPLKPWMIAAAWLLGVLTFAPVPALTLPTLPGLNWLLPSTAPFKADKLCVLCLEDSSAQARSKLTSNQENILRAQDDTSVRKFVKDHGGDFQVLDPKNAVTMDIPWVNLAMAVPHPELPCIIAASPRGGFAQAIPPNVNPADLTKKMRP